MSQIFMAQEPANPRELAQVAEKLAAAGHRIIRGPEVVPGIKRVFSPEVYAEFFADTDVIVVSSQNLCSREVMLAAPRLRAVITPAIGVDSVDVDAADELGIIVGHGAFSENVVSVAESTVMLFAALFYHMTRSAQLLRTNVARPWERRARMMRGKLIGLIGFGRIGRAVAEHLQSWDVKLQAYDPYVSPADWPASVRAVGLATLLTTSDLVSLHVTLTKETYNLIGEAEIRAMKPGALLVNTSRGGVVNEEALYRACKDGHLGGAALDTFKTEPLPLNSPLRELAEEENVILTPHFVSHTREVHEVMPEVMLTNIQNVLAGEPPLYTKNPGVIPKWRQRLAKLAAQPGG